MVHELLAQGHSRRAIARHLGWSLNTVLRYANAARIEHRIWHPIGDRFRAIRTPSRERLSRARRRRPPAARIGAGAP
ncbi:helix-turn-helix domain-containing protein [Streptomyces gardneri]|uniref:helix-turn-helix domain-containing protein n=1 Tax=Streptomyces gardneri TaxID=66892 RepID=UPI0021018472|nr:helix-turn-helix domain-containing protein [Streptomyces gardneri]